ncbi:MAG: tol-pal system protein YbgF [Calditrichaeota bacterium]|nr:tol-pal system protein YbgF [Calditrichota bacterium]
MKKFLLVSAAVLLGVYFVGCAGTKPKASEKTTKGGVNEVMDVQAKGKTAEAKTAPEEDEVLKLLGITPEEKKKAETPESTNVIEQEKQLKAKIAQLEQNLNQKDSEVNQLQSEVKAKERKLKELQEMLTTLKSSQGTASSSPGYSTKSSTNLTSFKARYEDALQTYNRRHYKEAIRKFRELLQENPNTSLSDNCQYWIGECYYSLGKYDQAVVEFEKVFTFPNSNKEDDAQLKIGMSYMKLGDKQRAKNAFKTLIEKYPKSEYVPLARRFLNQLQ